MSSLGLPIWLDWAGVVPVPGEPASGPYNYPGLEIGGGPHPLRPTCRQFDAIDWSGRTGLSYDLGDARQLPYPDRHFGYVFASNLLEHFPDSETGWMLKEWTRVLVPGGHLELVVPDAMGILADFFQGRQNWPDTAERILGSQDYDGNRHYTAFTLSSFASVIQMVPDLKLLSLGSSHRGGGVHARAYRRS